MHTVLLLAVSEPLTELAALYQPDLDRVLAWHDATYSQHDWPLPRLLLPHPDSTTRAAVFAAALLSGKVVPGLAALSGGLVAPAASAARPELVGLARVGELLQALQSKQVRCTHVCTYYGSMLVVCYRQHRGACKAT
jgi:ATP-dependent RNA helicase DHX37/DHR1